MKTCKDCGISCEKTCVEQLLFGADSKVLGVPVITCGKIPADEALFLNPNNFKLIVPECDLPKATEDDL